MNKILAIALASMLMAGALVGCGAPAATSPEKPEAPASTGSEEKKVFTIGISQFAEHGALDASRDGFIDALADAGFKEGDNLKIALENAQGDTAVTTQIAQNFDTTGADLVYAIATPSAQSAMNVLGKKGTPIIYAAVTDPMSAGLAKEDGTNNGEITGVSDALPLDVQADLIKEMFPNAVKVGILYTTSEANSIVSIEEYQKLAPQYGFELEIVGVNTFSEISGATDAILPKIDVLANLTDNTIVSAMPTILDKAIRAKVPVFGSEVAQVEQGALAGEGIDYYKLGRQAGEMAAKILSGEKKASEIEYISLADTSTSVNKKTAAAIGVTVPQSVLDRASDIFE